MHQSSSHTIEEFQDSLYACGNVKGHWVSLIDSELLEDA